MRPQVETTKSGRLYHVGALGAHRGLGHCLSLARSARLILSHPGAELAAGPGSCIEHCVKYQVGGVEEVPLLCARGRGARETGLASLLHADAAPCGRV